MMFLILLVEELEGCLEWTLKFQEKPSKRAWWIDYISVGNKRIAVTAAVTWYRGIRETFNFFDSNATDNFDRYYRNGSGGWTREATQIAVPEGQFDNGSGTLATIGNRNFGNYWFYLGQQEILLWFMVEKTLIHLLLYYPPIRQLTYH
jgi:hypothetical protein